MKKNSECVNSYLKTYQVGEIIPIRILDQRLKNGAITKEGILVSTAFSQGRLIGLRDGKPEILTGSLETINNIKGFV